MKQIFILESLREGDDKVGQEIHKVLEKENSGVSKYFDIDSKDDFFEKIQTIIENYAYEDLPCFLHLDCHGDELGIQLKNDECIDWEEFKCKFRDLYIATGRQLIVCMSACKGYNIAKMVAYFEPCPYYAICGSFNEIGFEESKNGYLTFYKSLQSGKSILEAVKDVNEKEKGMGFIAHRAEELFNIAIDSYLKKLTPEYLKAEKEKKIQYVKDVWGNDQNRIDYLDYIYTLQGQQMLLQRKYKSIFFS